MIEFGLMTVVGYASIEQETFDWGKQGLNIIQAPNGTGKTTFINALVWVLYGKPLSGSVEPWEHTRSSSYKGTYVKLTLFIDDIPYVIKRYKNYPKFKNSLILEIDGPEPEEGEKKDIQDQITKALGYSYDLFKNAIIFGQKLKRLIAETGPNKKKVFDDAFEVTYISKAKDIASEKLKEFREEGSMELHKWTLLEEKVRGKKKEIEGQELLVANFEDNKKEKIKKIRDLIKEKRAEIKVINEKEDWEQTARDLEHELEIFEKDAFSQKEITQMEKDKTKLEGKKENEEEKIYQVNENIKLNNDQLKKLPQFCDKCGKPYTAPEQKKAKEVIKAFKKENEEKLAQYKEQVSIYDGQILEKHKEIASATNLLETIDNINKELERLEEVRLNISDLELQVFEEKQRIKEIKESKLDNTLDELGIELTDLETQLKAQAKIVKKVNGDIKTYEWLIKDPLSNSGLKAFIFNMMLDDINERLEYYTSFIGFQVAFVMDMQSANRNLETFVFKGEHPVPYGDLSGGQQQAVDIATAFAIHDVVSDNKECSLLVMDEVFESLDRDNIEIMAEVIQDKAKDKCLYLVTHRAEFNPTNANIIQVEYENNTTYLA